MVYAVIYQTSLEYDSDYRGQAYSGYARNFRSKENVEKFVDKLNATREEYATHFYHFALYKSKEARDEALPLFRWS